MRTALPALLLLLSSGCGFEQGTPIDLEELGYRPCSDPWACGPGRFCNSEGFCAAECRRSGDCVLLGEADAVCTALGQCVAASRPRACQGHAACGSGGLCHGRCATSGALCAEDAECPWPDEGCLASCAAPCGLDDDCLGLGDGLACTPLGLCLPPGWERWVSPAALSPVACRRDSQCQALGWGHACDCKLDGEERCAAGQTGLCVDDPSGLLPGAGASGRPAHAFEGTWGMRLNMAMVTLGLPLLQRQTTNASNLVLIRIRHQAGDRLELTEKLCDLGMTNFSDSGAPPSDLIHVTIPAGFLAALPLVRRSVDLPAAGAGSPWRSDQSLEVRGAALAEPALDPLPSRRDFEADPDDPRFLDQDEDGRVGMTTLTDGVLRGEIYIVQRVRLALDGQVVDADRVEGLVRLVTEERLISSNKPELVYDIQTTVHPDPDRTFFRMQRLAPKASCAELQREASRAASWLHPLERLPD
jgi:hypothetical protein